MIVIIGKANQLVASIVRRAKSNQKLPKEHRHFFEQFVQQQGSNDDASG